MDCLGAGGRDDSIKEMPSQGLTISMVGQDATDTAIPSQSQSVEMTSQESQAEELMPSQSQSVKTVSQESQSEMMETGAAMEPEGVKCVPLEGALEDMDIIESGQWSSWGTWRQPENAGSVKQVRVCRVESLP